MYRYHRLLRTAPRRRGLRVAGGGSGRSRHDSPSMETRVSSRYRVHLADVEDLTVDPHIPPMIADIADELPVTAVLRQIEPKRTYAHFAFRSFLLDGETFRIWRRLFFIQELYLIIPYCAKEFYT